jgi:ABC-type nitrate/sulfonate/bicarbonate transport system substrate-binding protein
MNRKIQMAIASVVIIAAVLYAVPRDGIPKQSSQTEVSLRLAWIPGATFTGDHVALKKGYWKDAGLDVTLNPGGFEYDAIKLVASGADTFGISSGPQILYARAQGVPVVAIGAVIPRSPIGWVAKKSSGIVKPQDFSGKKIGAQFGTHTEITLEALCAKLGIDLKSFQRIPVKFDPRPFVVGAIDVLPVYIIDQPVDLAAQGLELRIIDPGDYGVELAFGNIYFTTQETIRTKPELVRSFLAGAKRGWMWTNGNREKSIKILAKAAPDANKETLLAKLNATLNFIMKGRAAYLGVFPMTNEEWQVTRDILARHGNLDADVDPAKCFTNEFIPR